jgi:hypothetical protein
MTVLSGVVVVLVPSGVVTVIVPSGFVVTVLPLEKWELVVPSGLFVIM